MAKLIATALGKCMAARHFGLIVESQTSPQQERRIQAMAQHPAIAPNRAAVITGAASGIGLAAAKRFAELGMKSAADLPGDALERAAAEVGARRRQGGRCAGRPTDVGRPEDVERLKDKVYAAFGEVARADEQCRHSRAAGRCSAIRRAGARSSRPISGA